MIKDRLQHRKVLIVLDDVDNLEHLEELAGSHDWFGEGSRIIITTRDQHVLNSHRVDVTHNITLLNDDESIKLFHKHARRNYRPMEDYQKLSKDVVTYAGGLPLALRVLGRFLSDKDMNEWRSASDRLKEIPDANILEVLKISFDGLKTIEKELFLDIACFFRRKYKYEEAMMILDACGFYPVIGIKVLVQKALITISEDRDFDMHDLVEEMAHYIVRGEHPNNPEKHSRVWKKEDILEICAMDATTNLDKIEAINVHRFRSDEAQHVLQVAANMKRVRWILLKDMKKLPLTIMPENFPPRQLCCLILGALNAEELWEGYKYLSNLKMIKLEFLENLMETPDFGGLPNLERFMIEGSQLLEEIHPSFKHLEKLVSVAIEYCKSLKIVPTITRSMELETFVLSGCKYIQQNIANFLPHNMNNIREWFFSGRLRKLDLSWCGLADRDIRSAAGWELPNLQELCLDGNSFVSLNFSLLRLPRLLYLNISCCERLVELLELPSSIAVIIANWCTSLKTLGDISNCKWLWKVWLSGVKRLGPLVGEKLLDSMLQGNAKDYFINITSHTDVWRGFKACLNWEKKFSMQLPQDWYDKYSGILMFVRSDNFDVEINITIKQGVDEDFRSELGQDSNETKICFYERVCVGYVSFSTLMNTASLDSTYNMLSFSVHCANEGMSGAVLIPRKSSDDPMKTTDCSEFWDDGKTFKVQHDSDSSIKILWTPRTSSQAELLRAASRLSRQMNSFLFL